MCFFNSLAVSAAAIAGKYGRGMDIIEAVRHILAEKEGYGRTGVQEEVYCIAAYSRSQCVIVSDSDELQVMQWGLIPHSASAADRERYDRESWFKNARAEEIFTTWPYRMLIQSRRCVIPSTGYFEYHYDAKGKTQPYFIYPGGREVFPMAGLWDTWQHPQTGEQIKSFVQITTAANPFSAKIHNGGRHPGRQPLILEDGEVEKWLNSGMTDKKDISKFLKVYPENDMRAHPVSKDFRSMNPRSKEVIREEPTAEKLF